MRSVEGIISAIIVRRFAGRVSPILIAVGGPGGTGKSTFSRKLADQLDGAKVLSLDDYKVARSTREEKGVFGPHPEANEMDLIEEHLSRIKEGCQIKKPVYDFNSGKSDKAELFSPAIVNIIEGEVSTYPRFKQFFDLSIFVDSRLNTQLMTRLKRAIGDRGYTFKKAWSTFFGSNVGEFAQFGSESKSCADIKLYCSYRKNSCVLEIENITDRISAVYRQLNSPLEISDFRTDLGKVTL